jgi:hypothetical protein
MELELELLAAAERSHTARRAGAASTGQWAAQLVHADGGEAQRQVGLAIGLAGHAPTRRALGEGRISPGHAEVILCAERQLPATVSPEQRTTVERSLLTQAETMSPSSLRRVARRAISALEPDTSAVDTHEDAILRDEEADARPNAPDPARQPRRHGVRAFHGSYPAGSPAAQDPRDHDGATTRPLGCLAGTERPCGWGPHRLGPRPGYGVLRAPRAPAHRSPPLTRRGDDRRDAR